MIERIGMTDRWSDAVVVGGLIFLAGHVAEQTRGQSVKVQTEEVLLSLDETLAQAGVSKNNLVSVTIYLADMVGFAAMNEAWDAWVAKGHAPARATVEARLAHPDLLVEMTAIASR
ncbi:RidA family protein [Bosea sp. (in: a-proteobacteria)]|jgi:enamine deaminase RidA (YjgF/YER057c/UK114 family)|uniref:RidA family protein n=1 Tax=Bosea sp. (in: a-proteobacteria) TaxID=1871050 RepID=UPI002DDD3789|nr:RidA family protein [Bosea sp. (in: a-proteobacteria)]HEV2513320.1 RidA family protein [Bosea sp. (in: a-proteobacteria)]